MEKHKLSPRTKKILSSSMKQLVKKKGQGKSKEALEERKKVYTYHKLPSDVEHIIEKLVNKEKTAAQHIQRTFRRKVLKLDRFGTYRKGSKQTTEAMRIQLYDAYATPGYKLNEFLKIVKELVNSEENKIKYIIDNLKIQLLKKLCNTNHNLQNADINAIYEHLYITYPNSGYELNNFLKKVEEVVNIEKENSPITNYNPKIKYIIDNLERPLLIKIYNKTWDLDNHEEDPQHKGNPMYFPDGVGKKAKKTKKTKRRKNIRKRIKKTRKKVIKKN